MSGSGRTRHQARPPGLRRLCGCPRGAVCGWGGPLLGAHTALVNGGSRRRGQGWGAPPRTEPGRWAPALCFQTAGTGLDSEPPPGAGSPSGGPQETPGSGLQTRSWGSRDHAGLNPCSWRGWCPQLAGHPTDCFQIAQGQHRARGDPEQPRAHCSPAAKKVRGDEGRGRGRIFSPGGDRWPPQEGSPGRPLPAR